MSLYILIQTQNNSILFSPYSLRPFPTSSLPLQSPTIACDSKFKFQRWSRHGNDSFSRQHVLLVKETITSAKLLEWKHFTFIMKKKICKAVFASESVHYLLVIRNVGFVRKLERLVKYLFYNVWIHDKFLFKYVRK